MKNFQCYRLKVNMSIFLILLQLIILCSISEIKAEEVDHLENSGSYMTENEEEETVVCGNYICKISNNNIVEIMSNGDEMRLEMQYDENGYRTKKNDISFQYEEGLLVREIRDGVEIQYNYELNPRNLQPLCVSFTINDNTYFFNRDAYGKIISLSDESGQAFAQYEYDGIKTIRVLEYKENGWIENTDNAFMGNYNKLRLYGGYYDSETGWYYENRMYTDLSNGKVAGLQDNSQFIVDVNPYSELLFNSGISLLGYEVDDRLAEEWMYELLADSTYNAAKQAGWYNAGNASTVEIVARTIYGENTSNITDQKGIAWVILNRLHSSAFPNNIKSVVMSGGEFLGMANSVALQAMSPESAGWRNATYLACLMCTNSAEDCWNATVGKPSGISTQVYFRSAKNHLIYGQSFFDTSSGICFTYDNGTTVNVCNVAIAGLGSFSTVEAMRSQYNTLDASAQWCNIYFNHQ